MPKRFLSEFGVLGVELTADPPPAAVWFQLLPVDVDLHRLVEPAYRRPCAVLHVGGTLTLVTRE